MIFFVLFLVVFSVNKKKRKERKYNRRKRQMGLDACSFSYQLLSCVVV